MCIFENLRGETLKKMIVQKDIIERIELDFGEKSPEVIRILEKEIFHAADVNNDRMLRCILLLTGGDFQKLMSKIAAAKSDPRDVMYWAEYVNDDKSYQLRRVRDLANPFGEAEFGGDL